jgi:hypothetical protein
MVTRMDHEKEWAARVAAWRASGQSALKYCEGKPFSVHSLRRWSSELAARRASDGFVVAPKPRERRPRIARAVIRAERPDDTTFTPPPGTGVTLAIGGVQVRVERGFDPDVLRSVIDSLAVASLGRTR